jgi:hypothetical protein
MKIDPLDVVIAATKRRTRWTERDELRAAIDSLGEERSKKAVPALRALLDRRDDEIPHWAANALLAIGEREALEDLAARLRGAHAMSAVQAIFALGGKRAFERLAPVFDEVRAKPKRANAVASIVLALLHDELAPIAKSDTRWLDLCFEIAHASGVDLAFAPIRVLHRAGDARVVVAFVRALDAFPFALVASHVRFACDRRDVPALEAAAQRSARHAANLRKLAKELSKKAPRKRPVLY